MYCGVPNTTPAWVFIWLLSWRSLATEKSSSFTKSGEPAMFSRNTLSGLMSRWMIPIECASASDAQHWMRTFITRFGVMPLPTMAPRRTMPSRNSIVMKNRPSEVWPKSNMRMVLGCCSREHAFASLEKRWIHWVSPAICGFSTLIAMTRSIETWRAL